MHNLPYGKLIRSLTALLTSRHSLPCGTDARTRYAYAFRVPIRETCPGGAFDPTLQQTPRHQQGIFRIPYGRLCPAVNSPIRRDQPCGVIDPTVSTFVRHTPTHFGFPYGRLVLAALLTLRCNRPPGTNLRTRRICRILGGLTGHLTWRCLWDVRNQHPYSHSF